MQRLATVAIIITRARPSLSEAAPPAMLPNTLTRWASAASAMPAPCHDEATPEEATKYAGSHAQSARQHRLLAAHVAGVLDLQLVRRPNVGVIKRQRGLRVPLTKLFTR